MSKKYNICFTSLNVVLLIIYIIIDCNFCTLLQRWNIQIANILLIFGVAVKIWERKLFIYIAIKSTLVPYEMRLDCLTVNITIILFSLNGLVSEIKAPITTMDERNCQPVLVLRRDNRRGI